MSADMGGCDTLGMQANGCVIHPFGGFDGGFQGLGVILVNVDSCHASLPNQLRDWWALRFGNRNLNRLRDR